MALKPLKCPIDGKEAAEVFPRTHDASEYVCPDCGRFRISRSAFTIVEKSTAENRNRMLKSAKRRLNSTSIPMITTYDA